MYSFLWGVRRKYFAQFPGGVKLVIGAGRRVSLITDPDINVPKTELPWIYPLKMSPILANNMFFEHTDRLLPGNLNCKGARSPLLVDEAENGYKIAHCVLSWRWLYIPSCCWCWFMWQRRNTVLAWDLWCVYYQTIYPAITDGTNEEMQTTGKWADYISGSRYRVKLLGLAWSKRGVNMHD